MSDDPKQRQPFRPFRIGPGFTHRPRTHDGKPVGEDMTSIHNLLREIYERATAVLMCEAMDAYEREQS